MAIIRILRTVDGSKIAGAPPPTEPGSGTQIPCTDVTDTIMVHSPPRANREVMRWTQYGHANTS